MNDSDFYKIYHNQLQFHNCELNAANFEETKLNGLDLSSTYFEELYLDLNKVKGLKIAPQQAPIIAMMFGIKIAE